MNELRTTGGTLTAENPAEAFAAVEAHKLKPFVAFMRDDALMEKTRGCLVVEDERWAFSDEADTMCDWCGHASEPHPTNYSGEETKCWRRGRTSCTAFEEMCCLVVRDERRER